MPLYKLTQQFIALIIIFGGSYLIGSFIHASFDIQQWGIFTRVMLGVITPIAYFIQFVISPYIDLS